MISKSKLEANSDKFDTPNSTLDDILEHEEAKVMHKQGVRFN